jgi:hypothetical protein
LYNQVVQATRTSRAARRCPIWKVCWGHCPNFLRSPGVTAFWHDLLQDLPIQAEICHQSLQAPVLISQLPQLSQLIDPQPGILFFPQVVGSLADPYPAANIGHLLARFSLAQNRHDLSSL